MADIAQIPEEEYLAAGHTACIGCGEAIAIRHILKAAGKNTIICQATGCPQVYTTMFPNTAWRVPWIHVAFENVSAVASGVREALDIQGKRDTNVIAMGGDGATFDIGFGSLSGMLERGHKVLYVCLDNGAYENTGVQRSSATPKHAWTTTSPIGSKIKGKTQWKKPMPAIIAAHEIPYVATASLHDIHDLIKKVRYALSVDGPSYIQILCACIPGWKSEPDKSIEYSKLAFKTKTEPIFEIIDGKMKLSDVGDSLPVEEYLKGQGRFKHVSKDNVKEIQEYVDKRYDGLKKQSENKG